MPENHIEPCLLYHSDIWNHLNADQTSSLTYCLMVICTLKLYTIDILKDLLVYILLWNMYGKIVLSFCFEPFLIVVLAFLFWPGDFYKRCYSDSWRFSFVFDTLVVVSLVDWHWSSLKAYDSASLSSFNIFFNLLFS